MLKIKLPIQFTDGKQMYDGVLAMINRISQPLARQIHEDMQYNPFHIELPDLLFSLSIELDAVMKAIPGIEVLEEKSHTELLTGKPEDYFTLQMDKVTFRFRGWYNPIPDSCAILASLKNNWNALYPEKIRIPIPTFGEKSRIFTRVVRQNTITEKITTVPYPNIVAFKGKVALKSYQDADYIKEFSTLIRYGEWSGVGAHRSMGMGKMRIVS